MEYIWSVILFLLIVFAVVVTVVVAIGIGFSILKKLKDTLRI